MIDCAQWAKLFETIRISDISDFLQAHLGEMLRERDPGLELHITDVAILNMNWTDTIITHINKGWERGWYAVLDIHHDSGPIASQTLFAALVEARIFAFQQFKANETRSTLGISLRADDWRALASLQLMFGVDVPALAIP